MSNTSFFTSTIMSWIFPSFHAYSFFPVILSNRVEPDAAWSLGLPPPLPRPPSPAPTSSTPSLHRADTNSNGLVEFSEFVALVSPELLDDRSPYSEDQLRRLFEIFDRDGNGFITAAELAHSMAKLGHALTAKELTGMIEEADTDGDGRINFREFSRAITAAAFDNVFS
uniref:EF-hand domain-containing protein n=1 Tax=Aegilops tauschii TaxID=37682 RepID=M8B777_AEGTA